MTKNFHEQEFSSTNDTKHNLFMIYTGGKFCPVYGVIFQNFAPVIETYFQNVALTVGPNSEFSKAYM